MNFKTTGLLLGLLIVVGAAWLLFPRTEGPPGTDTTPSERTPQTTNVLEPRPRDEDIVRVELERQDKPRLVFERRPSEAEARASDDWRMIGPLNVPAEGFKVGGLVRTLTGLQSQSKFEPGTSGAPTAAEAGLEPPAATITLIDNEGKRTGVQIGKKAAMSSDTYVRLAGRPTVHVVPRDLRPQLQDDMKDYRAKRLLRIKPDEVVNVRIEHDGRRYDFSRADGEWIINEPVRAYADGAKIRSKLLSPLSLVQAAEFVDDAPTSLAPYGLDGPFLIVTITTEKKLPVPPEPESADTQPVEPRVEIVTETHVARIGGFADLKNERRYALTGAGPAVVAVAAMDVTGLVPNLNELRDPRVTRLKAADLTEIRLAAGETVSLLRTVDGRWQGSGDLADLDPDAAADLAAAIEQLTAISTIDGPEAPATYGLDAPRAELTVTAKGAVPPLVLRIGAETASGRNAYVSISSAGPPSPAHLPLADQPTVMVVSEAQAARLAIDPLALRSREIFAFQVEQLQRIHVVRDGATRVLARDGEAWTLVEPPDTPLAVAAARTLAQDLARLRARKVVARGDEARFGLVAPAATVHFEVALPPAATAPEAPIESPPPQAHSLRLGRAEGRAYARRDDDPYVFELDESVYLSLTGELIDPRLFTFEPEAVRRVKVIAPGGTLELARKDDRWVYTADPFVALDQKKVQDFVQDLSQLRVETWLAYRDGDWAAAGLASPPASLAIELTDGREFVVNMTQEQPGELPRRAGLVAEQRIFRLRQSDCEKMLRGLDEYLSPPPP